jgi:hypothetical protein
MIGRSGFQQMVVVGILGGAFVGVGVAPAQFAVPHNTTRRPQSPRMGVPGLEK